MADFRPLQKSRKCSLCYSVALKVAMFASSVETIVLLFTEKKITCSSLCPEVLQSWRDAPLGCGFKLGRVGVARTTAGSFVRA